MEYAAVVGDLLAGWYAVGVVISQVAPRWSAQEAGLELTAALLSGPEELRRRILSRLVKEVTYLKEDRNIEVTLVLPHPDVPPWLAAR